MKFRSDNKIKYSQGFRPFVGLPGGVEFEVRRYKPTGYKLTGFGYGQIRCPARVHPDTPYDADAYGNGSLFILGLTAKQRRRFEEAIESGKGND